MRIAELPVVFMSLDEPWADAFYADLCAKRPGALRVHGVRGLDACHKAAAAAAGTRWFVTVDADTIVDGGFFAGEIPDAYLTDSCRVEWASRNAVNGLTYGNGSLKCWPRAMVMAMRSHEAAPAGVRSIDHDIGKGLHSRAGAQRIQLPQVHARVEPAGTPYHAFRCGFREAVRLGLAEGDAARPGFAEWARLRLGIWCSVGRHAPNGLWVIYGARLGLAMARMSDWDPGAINDYRWFDRLWESIVAPRFVRPSGCGDAGGLEAEVRALGARIGAALGLEMPEIEVEASALLARAVGACRTPSNVDTLGHMYHRGVGVPRDPPRAMALFEVGAVLGLAGSHNNIARMHHLGHAEGASPELAELHYGAAVALGDRFAPYHLAQFLKGTAEPDPERIAALEALAAERGFARGGAA